MFVQKPVLIFGRKCFAGSFSWYWQLETTQDLGFSEEFGSRLHPLQKCRVVGNWCCKPLWRATILSGDVFTCVPLAFTSFVFLLHSPSRRKFAWACWWMIPWVNTQEGFAAPVLEQERRGGGIGGFAKSPAGIQSRETLGITPDQLPVWVQHWTLSPGQFLGTLWTRCL